MKISSYSLTIATIIGLSSIYAYCVHGIVNRPEPEPEAIFYADPKVCYSIDSHTHVDKIPNLHNTWQLTTECRVDPEEVFTAISMFYEGWTDEIGPDENLNILRAFSNLTIEWAEEPFKIPDEVWEGMYGSLPERPMLAYGEATWKKTPNIWIVRGVTGSLYDEPDRFLHELVHIALRASDPASRGDFDHEGPIIKAWTKKHTKLIQTIGDYIILLNQEGDI